MHDITAAQLLGILGKGAQQATADTWLVPLNRAMAEREINTGGRQAAFLAQLLHESGNLRVLSENLNYSAVRLPQVWPTRFPNQQAAQPYANNPERLANFVYAGRMGNGDMASGDGWRYRGRGLIQLTGRSNYKDCAAALSLDLLVQPELLAEAGPAARSAAWFWQSRGLNPMADGATGAAANSAFLRITRAINGGTVGLTERLSLWDRCREVLSVPR
ncbi:glycoside hydrolase family 19 protein [Duganella sp. Root1480D1]|uniref:glycoside hydrolase family 19 protein n=1 Tax=Duganella sp. Root1480D1 TaxID=1736471 RepID=UPI00070E18AC|nr:glycoside hydrolase family 19 protein [Duganella sp. Root1480D1]KQZ43316.1 glycoside hydrolase [Duganella sp. Root1480D1]